MKIVKVDQKKYILDSRVSSSEYLDVDRMVELKYTFKDKLEIAFHRLIKKLKG